MFKATKKLEDPPKVMTMQEIQEDLETFCKQGHINNREQVVGDLKTREDLSSLSLNEWWNGFEVNELQIEDLERLDKRLSQMKNELQQFATAEIQERRTILLQEIDENLKKIRQLKTPE